MSWFPSCFNRCVALCCALFLLPLACPADEVTVGFGKDKPPFVFGEEGRGLEIDIFRKALAYRGHELEVRHFDNKVLVEAILMDRVQAVATARTTDPDICQVKRFIHFDNVAITLKSRALQLDKVEDLAQYRVVAWEKAYLDLGERYQRLFAPKERASRQGYFEHRSQEAQVKMFWLGRADVLVIDKVIFQWYRQHLPPRYESQREVEYHPIFNGPTDFPALFRDQKLCSDFQAGLDELKQSGTYEALYRRYLQ
ncbi:transporter substrate-binding domain-containing protein [Marinobacteraceae bacterium S3BR75-40.1]